MLVKRGIRQTIAFLLVIASFIGFSVIGFPAQAVDIPPGNSNNGYVTDIKFYQHTITGTNYDENSLIDCAFNPVTTDYDINMIAWDGTYNNAYASIGVTDTTGTLWRRILIDGVVNNINSLWEQKIMNTPARFDLSQWISGFWPDDGAPHTLSILIGTKYDSNGDGKVNYKDEFQTYDVYNFHVTFIPGLKTLSITDSSGTALQMNPAYVNGCNSRDFTISTEDSSISLSVSFSDSTTLYIGDNSYTEALTNEAITLAPFIAEGSGYAEIPLRLVNTAGKENTYTIKVLLHDYTPVIVQQPVPTTTCDKGDAIELSVEAQGPEGSSLSYQWYNTHGIIEGATESTLHPDTAVASTNRYWCVVTNTVAGTSFTAQSNYADVTVNLTYLNAPVFNVQPGTKVWKVNAGYSGWSEEAYPTTYPENTTFDEIFLDVDNRESAHMSIVFYLNDTPSYDGAEVLEGNLKTTYGSGSQHNIRGFSTDRLFTEGTYYVGCIATFSVSNEAIEPISTASDFVELTFIQAPLEFEGSGTQDDPYKLQNAEDFSKLSAYSQGGKTFEYMYFKVINDVTLPEGWTSIGTDTVFLGYFDGNNKTISYAAGSSPLFENVGATTICDLTIYGEEINGCGLINGVYNGDNFLHLNNITLKAGSSTLKSGVIQGAYRAVSRIAFDNCTVETGVTIGYTKDQNGIGSFLNGLVGTMTNCQSGADVYGASLVGGLAGGNANSMGLCTFTGCSFTGTVTATGNNIGGIIGRGYEDATAPNTRLIRVIDCTVSGTVSGVKNVGGLIGSEGGLQQSYDEASKGVVTGNTVTAAVTGSSNVGAIAGLYSHLDRYTVFENNTFTDSLNAFGKVYHVDTSAVAYGWHDGVFYFNSSATYTAEQLEEIYTALWTGWEDSGRWKPTSLITARERSDNPLNCDATVETIEVTTMPNKTEYVTNEAFDGTGMVVTLTDLNGATRELAENEYTVSFDSSRPGEAVVTITFGTAVTTFTVNVSAPAGETITVSFSVLGDTHHEMSEGSHGLWLGGLTEWLPETQYTVSANATVWDLINQAFDADDTLSFEHSFNTSYNSEYISAVQKGSVKLTEKDDGRANSGWMYALNGEHVQVGVSNQYLTDGDAVILHWCDDYQADEAAAAQQQQDQQAAYAVEALIDAIVTPVTLESEAAITAARAAYDALNDNAKSYVDPDCYAILTAAEAALAELKASAQRVADVIAAIDAIGEVTLDSADAISTARTAYNALTDDEKALVTNYTTLTDAETALQTLQEQAASAQRVADVIAAINALPAADELTLNDETAVAAARAAFDALSDAEQAQITNLAALEAAEAKIDQLEAEQDQQAASAADQVIAALPAADAITLDDAAAVAEARAAYDALTPEQQALVNNYNALLAAEAKIAELQEQAASAQRVAEATAAIDALPAADEVTLADEVAVIAARMAYDALSDAEKAQVSADKLIAAEAKIAELKAQQSSQEKITDATDKINAIPAADAVTLADEAAIAAARAAYDALTDAEKAQVDASALVAAEARLAALKFAALKPEVKTANAKNGKIELTITPVAGAVKYKIYVSEKADGTYKEAATVTEAKYTYNGTPGTRYFFKVVAVNGAGVESAESAVASQFRLPAQVTSLKVKSKKKKEVTLTWKKVTGAKKYVIYMSKNGKTGWKKIGTVKTNKFTYKKAPAGKKMYFRVQAVTANGKKGEFSKAVSVKVKK